MLALTLIFGLLAVALLTSARSTGRAFFQSSGVAFALIAILCLVSSSLTIIPAGNVGVPVVFGKVSDTYLTEGIQFVNPLANVEKFSVRTETLTMNQTGESSVPSLSADGLSINMDASVAFRLAAADAPWIYRNLGRDYVTAILKPAARAVIREVTAKYTLQDAYSTKREEMADRMRQGITTHIKSILGPSFKGTGLEIQEFFLRNIELPQNLKAAIEEKMRADQEAQRMSFVLQREQQEAERKRIEAKGIRDFQAIVTEGISDKLLQWKGIEATEQLAKSGNSKVVIIGAGKSGLPVILNPGQ